MFTITVDRARMLLTLKACGTIDDAELATAAGKVATAIRSLGTRSNEHVILYDFSAAQIVSANVLSQLGAYFADPEFRQTWGRRAAFVTRSAMVTFQVGGIQAATIEMCVFSNRRSARQWLLQPVQDARIAA